MATLKKAINESKAERETLVKAMKIQFPDLFKRARTAPKVNPAFLQMLSPTLRASLEAEMKKAAAGEESPYEPMEVGEFVLDWFKK